MSEIEITDWAGCYRDGWKSLIVEAAFAHPAKFSRGLIRRIYEHAVAEGWLHTGDVVCDPFGGIALGGFDAAKLGAHWIGCELEPRFREMGVGCECEGFSKADWRRFYGRATRVSGTYGFHWCPDCLAQMNSSPPVIRQAELFGGETGRPIPSSEAHHYVGNIELWKHRYGHRPGYGSARLIQGDSRKLSEVLREAGLCVSSPPFAESLSSGAVSDSIRADLARRGHKPSASGERADYGSTPGNLGNLPATEAGLKAVISSPPYLDARQEWQTNSKDSENIRYGKSDGQLSAMKQGDFSLVVSSPPFVGTVGTDSGFVPLATPGQAKYKGNHYERKSTASQTGEYPQSEGQLGAMKESSDGFRLAVGSPPYADSIDSGKNGIDWDKARAQKREGDAYVHEEMKYGESPGQLGAMPDKGFDLVCSSPPYEGDVVKMRSSHLEAERLSAKGIKHVCGMTQGAGQNERYSDSADNVGNKNGQDFWTAARQIVEQTYLVLAPGAHAIWVVKGFVRKKTYVDFPDQWRQLCEAVGFVTLHWHNASLVEHSGTQRTLDGGEDKITVERKSFFRRLAEKNGSPAIDAEVVLCMIKPTGAP